MTAHMHGRIVDAVRYDGSFDLDFLRDGESVRSTGDGSGVIVRFGDGWETQVAIGKWVVRHECGMVAVHDWPAVARLHGAAR